MNFVYHDVDNPESKQEYILYDDDRIFAVHGSVLTEIQDKETYDTLYDYVNPNGFNTKVWGPCLWTFLHTISFNFPVKPTDQQQLQYKTFLQSLCYVLPCRICRENFRITMDNFDMNIHLHDRQSFSKFIYDMHTEISERTNGSFDVPYKTICKNYNLFRAKCNGTKGCISTACRTQIRIIPNIPQHRHHQTFTIHPSCRHKRSQARAAD